MNARRRGDWWGKAPAWLLALLSLPGLAAAQDCSEALALCEQALPGSVALISAGTVAEVLVDVGDDPAVLRAAAALRTDLGRVAKVADSPAPAPAHRATAILIGTLGRSARIDRIVRERSIDVSDVVGRWEAHLMQVVESPEPGLERALLIVGSDRRGTAFGAYGLSRALGVSPWHFWADVPAQTRTSVHVAPGRRVDAPAVRYRGIFINDEDPALGGWMRATYGGPNHRFYEHVFDLILRLRGNMLWPAMWGRAFYDDDPRNAGLADAMGIVVATSHHEPMMRAHVEWARYGRGPWDYRSNREVLRGFWREGIERLQGREALVTLGMRGDGDEAMTEGTAIDLLERIVADQRRILADVTARPPEHTPQVWALYKEVQDYFDAGMQVPDDVTLLFADDNWGNIRRLPQPGATRAGGYGVYYHFDYVGGPRNYKWINTTQIERTWEQMRLAWSHGVERLWIVNVGDIKPMEFPISFFLDQAWNPEAMTRDALEAYPAAWAAEQFGPAHAGAIGDLLSQYTRFNARRKPELITPDTWSQVDHDEADRVLRDWNTLAERSLAIGAKLPAVARDAWYQLVEYPVLASANLNALHIAVGRNRLHAEQQRASTAAWAEEARRLFARDAELARVYEQDIAGGKWIHMMSQPRIGYTHWQQPDRNVLPALAMVDVRERGTMGVAVEGDRRGWPVPAATARLPELDPLAAPTRKVEVFNRGSAPFSMTARSSHPWLRVHPESSEVADALPLRLTVDWQSLPPGDHLAVLDLRGSERTEVRVLVPVHVPDGTASGFVESEHGVVIEAGSFTRAVAAQGIDWETIAGLGRTSSGVTSVPPDAPSTLPGEHGPRLEYPIFLRAEGEVELRVLLSPTLDFQRRGGLRYAVAIGDEAPRIVTLELDPTPGHAHFPAWQQAVADSVHVGRSLHSVRAGAQTLRFWRVDPGVVVQRFELARDRPRESYLGPPESPRR